MKATLLKKWRKNVRIRNLDPGNKFLSKDWVVTSWTKFLGTPKILSAGTLKDCLSVSHSILREKIEKHEEKIKNKFYTRI